MGSNLLKNPDFDHPEGWLHGWTVTNPKNNGDPYIYQITEKGGGHGSDITSPSQGPHSGSNAVELYTTNRGARIAQEVQLEPGRYRFSVQARDNMGGSELFACQLVVKLGEDRREIPVISVLFRPYTVEFDIARSGEYNLEVESRNYGIAVDSLSLEPVDKTAKATHPDLYFDLIPTSYQRSQGFQPYLVGEPQWLNFAFSSANPQRVKAPVAHFYIPPGVTFGGINTRLLNNPKWKRSSGDGKESPVEVVTQPVTLNGLRYTRHSFPLPRFMQPRHHPNIVELGGAWVEVSHGENARIFVEVEDEGLRSPLQEIILIPVERPARVKTPQKILTVAYAVHDWTMDLEMRKKAIPSQFALMGYNVWSVYGVVSPDRPISPKQQDNEAIATIAAQKYGVTRFWGNFGSFFETSHGWRDLSEDHQDVHVVTADGKTRSNRYNVRTLAENHPAWRDSALKTFQETIRRPEKSNLPFRITGFINNGMEGNAVSFDPATIAAFAETLKVDPAELTPEIILKRYDAEWKRYNLGLYSRALRNWTDALRQVDPKIITVNSASSYGPKAEGLQPTERMEWAKQVDFNMPQWYGPMRYLGPEFYETLKTGVDLSIFGGDQGHADLIPLSVVSMGLGLDDPMRLRHRLFDYVSSSPVVKGMGYYIAVYSFADARFMTGLSTAHTLLADVEDYYADGKSESAEGRVKWTVNGEDAPPSQSRINLHTLPGKDRLALLSVISYKGGENLSITLDENWLAKLPKEKPLVVIDHLNGKVLPLQSTLEVDTRPHYNLGLLEIATGEWARQQSHLVQLP